MVLAVAFGLLLGTKGSSMRRELGFLLVAGLLVGGTGACSSGSPKASDTTTASTPTSTTASTEAPTTTYPDGESGSSNTQVAEYCKAVDDYVKKAKAAQGGSATASALADGEDLAKKAVALTTAGLSSADAKQVARCTKKSIKALIPD